MKLETLQPPHGSLPRLSLRILFAVCLCLASPSAVAAGKPNVLFMAVDDLKPILGCYGETRVQSPNIDRLAKRGILFERAYCNQALCAPSRNALLTGMRPESLGIYDLGTNFRIAAPDAVTLPQLFKQQGYRTEALGKIFHIWHGNHDDPDSWSVPSWHTEVIAYALDENRPGNIPARGSNHGAAYEAPDVPDEAYPDGALAIEVVRRLERAAANPDQPFFIAVGFVKPHLPFCAPKKYWELYNRDSFELAGVRTPPEGAPRYAPQFGGELRQYAGVPASGPIPEDLQRTLIHGYYASISYMDAQLGRVLDALDRLKLADNTIIVFWGDHGWHLGDHGIWCKHTNYEQAARIPLLIVAPGVTAPGSRTEALVESVDLYPTLGQLAGFTSKEVPQQLDGRSLVPLLKNPEMPWSEAIFHVYPRNSSGRGRLMGRAVRTDRYRLVEWKEPGAPADSADLELYDYREDPLEMKSLANSRPEVVRQLRAILSNRPEARHQVTRPGR